MDALGRYILSVTSAAVLFGILKALIRKGSTTYALLRLIGGLFLAFTAIAPIIDIDFDLISMIPNDYMTQGNTIVEQGKEIAEDHLHDIIIDRCEAYILDKAQSYQCSLSVEMELSKDSIPKPMEVRLQGSISPYAKAEMQKWITDSMGIPREHQIWIG